MAWRLYSFTDSTGRVRYLESEERHDGVSLDAAYALASSRVIGAAGRLGRLEGSVYREWPFPSEVLRRLVDEQGFRYPLASAGHVSKERS